MAFVEAIEAALGVTAEKHLLPMQDGDVPGTHADVSRLAEWVGVSPGTPAREGVARFVACAAATTPTRTRRRSPRPNQAADTASYAKGRRRPPALRVCSLAPRLSRAPSR
ncbi:MAG: hypothetical protein R2708_17025 [Vicinamibacterales bacterium]